MAKRKISLTAKIILIVTAFLLVVDVATGFVLLKLSEKRAADVGNVYPDLYVVCVEQAIECNGKVLKRPDSVDDIFNDFRLLNGQKYTLYTALTIHQNYKKRWQEIESLQLTRKHMTEEQIKDFVMKYGPSMFGVLGSVRLDEFPDMVEEKDLDFDLIKGLPIKNIVHFFEKLRK